MMTNKQVQEFRVLLHTSYDFGAIQETAHHLADDYLRLLAEMERVVAWAEAECVIAPPDDWEPYGIPAFENPYRGYGKDGDRDYIAEPDETNSGDIHYHGLRYGQWLIIKDIRRMLADLLGQMTRW